MKKEQLIERIRHFSGSSSEEATELLLLRDQYPYSQVLQVMAARAGKDHHLDNHQSLLQTAAIYSTDRSVLKDVMTYQAPMAGTVEADQISVVPAQIAYSSDSNLADETLRDLKLLSELKHNYEVSVEEFESGFTREKKPVKPKRAPGRPRKKKSDTQDPLIEEIKTTKKKIAPESEKTKEQIQIIDQFIKTQSTLAAKSKPGVSDPEDLSSKNNDFGDNIVSETLVEILVLQGKKEKAVEVLKKLIWKFPQKKAYFAAQIEELKK